jgi:O-antigen ligase
VTERVPKIVFVAVALVGALLLAYFAYRSPSYFTNQTNIVNVLLLEFLAVAIWLYRRVFFPIIIVTFLLAGVDLPVGSVWTAARWGVLAVGAAVGGLIMLKERRCHFGLFHTLALFAVLSAGVSAAVSRYTSLSFLKVLSLLLLFIYAGTGARLAVVDRENRFFSGLLLGCEIFVALIGGFYFLGIDAMGNPNSLGAVMGVVACPVLLWGILLNPSPPTYRRRLVLYAIAMYLTFASHGRAGMLAGFASCGLLCLALRRYRLLLSGIGIILILIAVGAIVQPEAFSRMASSFTSTIVFKGGDPSHGIFSSRQSPWQDAISTIQEHFWFGTGFGTSDNGHDATEDIGKFSSSTSVTSEHGSSYLAVTTWVGMAGVLPFFLLLFILLQNIIRTVIWMSRTLNPAHAAVPLAMVVLAGIIHAVFEDWLFAPGYYLCVFFWAMAFIFVDQVRALPVANPRSVHFWRAQAIPQDLGTVASGR